MIWNSLQTDAYEGMIAETAAFAGWRGENVRAYLSRPLGEGKFPGLVLIPHMPGWDEFYRETARRFTQHGYMVLCPDIYGRFGSGTPEEVAKKARDAGGVPDEQVMGDCEGAIRSLRSSPVSNGRVGVIGTCSGGRHAYLAACTLSGVDAAVDCWGGGVVAPKERLSEAQPVAPIDLTADLSCPLLGIFGNDDQWPTAEQVNQTEEELKRFGKDYEFHRYEGCGHGFWYYHAEMYRPKQAMDAWEKTLSFFDAHLKK